MMRACVVTTQRVCFDRDDCWACVERITTEVLAATALAVIQAKYPMGTIELARTQQDYRACNTPQSGSAAGSHPSVSQSSKGSNTCIWNPECRYCYLPQKRDIPPSSRLPPAFHHQPGGFLIYRASWVTLGYLAILSPSSRAWAGADKGAELPQLPFHKTIPPSGPRTCVLHELACTRLAGTRSMHLRGPSLVVDGSCQPCLGLLLIPTPP